MGGAKKKSISKIEDAQLAQEKKQQQRKAKGKVALEKRERGIRMPDIGDSKFLSDLSKIGALTPYSLASQYNLKMSVAKDLLEELARKSLVRQVGGNARIKIYQPAAAA